MKIENQRLKEEVLKQEMYSRRNNIKLYGITCPTERLEAVNLLMCESFNVFRFDLESPSSTLNEDNNKAIRGKNPRT